jgi:hypothetical protein
LCRGTGKCEPLQNSGEKKEWTQEHHDVRFEPSKKEAKSCESAVVKDSTRVLMEILVLHMSVMV